MTVGNRRFEDLTLRGQMQRLWHLGRLALARHGLEDARTRLVSPIQNTTFRVDSGSGKRYALRVHNPDADEREIWSELTWLAAISNGTGLMVPEPVSTTGGELVSVVKTDGVPEPRCCVLFRWLEGRSVGSERITPEQFGRVGAMMARLHLFSERWSPPQGFSRYHVDSQLVSDTLRKTLAVPSIRKMFDERNRLMVETSAERVSTAIMTLGYGSDVFGIVHADLVPDNLLFHCGEPAVLDFDDCCWGHYLYDMAFPLREVEDRYEYEDLRAAFLSGYEDVRPLSPQHREYIETFIAAAHLLRLLWVARRAERAAYREWTSNFVSRSLGKLERFLYAHQSW